MLTAAVSSYHNQSCSGEAMRRMLSWWLEVASYRVQILDMRQLHGNMLHLRLVDSINQHWWMDRQNLMKPEKAMR